MCFANFTVEARREQRKATPFADGLKRSKASMVCCETSSSSSSGRCPLTRYMQAMTELHQTPGNRPVHMGYCSVVYLLYLLAMLRAVQGKEYWCKSGKETCANCLMYTTYHIFSSYDQIQTTQQTGPGEYPYPEYQIAQGCPSLEPPGTTQLHQRNLGHL